MLYTVYIFINNHCYRIFSPTFFTFVQAHLMKTSNPLRSIVVVKEGHENNDFKMALAAWYNKRQFIICLFFGLFPTVLMFSLDCWTTSFLCIPYDNFLCFQFQCRNINRSYLCVETHTPTALYLSDNFAWFYRFGLRVWILRVN